MCQWFSIMLEACNQYTIGNTVKRTRTLCESDVEEICMDTVKNAVWQLA